MNHPSADQPGEGNYRLDVANFGPIVKAGVDLRPLTVFVGPSNTGKSYLAMLIYALHRCFAGQTHLFGGYFLRVMGWPSDSSELAFVPPGAAVRKRLKEWFLEALGKDPLPALPDEVASYMRSSLERIDGLAHAFESETNRCFGTDRSVELVRRYGSNVAANISLAVPQPRSDQIRYDFGIRKRNIQFSAHIPDIDSVTFPTGFNERNRFLEGFKTHDVVNRWDLERLLEDLTLRQFRSLLKPLYRNTYYLPAGRTTVMHTLHVVANSLIERGTTAGIRSKLEFPLLSGVLSDLLRLLLDMPSGQIHSNSGTARELAQHIESHILKGKISLDISPTGHRSFRYRPEGWNKDLPLMRASSMVSELAPVVLYLRHVVLPSDLLIIEEPESHLHPHMQSVFARELARAVRAGVRIVVTTHSDWFLEQIGNLVRMSHLSKRKRQGLTRQKYALSEDEVGVWLFKPTNRPKGSMVKEVLLDTQTGLYSTGFEEVSEALYNEGADIFNRMQEQTE